MGQIGLNLNEQYFKILGGEKMNERMKEMKRELRFERI